MRSKFWNFVDACDEATSTRVIAGRLAEQLKEVGFESFALVSHLPRGELRYLSVSVHNWSKQAVDHLFAERFDGRINPIFETVEHSLDVVRWSSRAWQASLSKTQRDWVSRLQRLTHRDGVSRAVKSANVPGSCSLIPHADVSDEQIRAGMRIANIAYHYLQVLQQPKLDAPSRLTEREHECLYRAAVFGERPRAVARHLGIKVSTVRTLRRKAYARLDAQSAEQLIWRMMETGQLFRHGRKRKPRA